MANSNIIQWNCRGLKSNRSNLDLLLTKYSSAIVCLQEMQLNGPLSLKGYVEYQKIGYTDGFGRAHGGVSVYVKKCFPQCKVPLNTNFQAVAVSVTLQYTFTICSVYISSSTAVRTADLEILYQDLPKPCLISSDFNAHSYLWGNIRDDTRVNTIVLYAQKEPAPLE